MHTLIGSEHVDCLPSSFAYANSPFPAPLVHADSYNKEGIAQAFVRFLESESQPKPPSTAPSLLNIVPSPPHATPNPATASNSTPPPPSVTTTASAASGSSPATAPDQPTPVAVPAVVQPIVINDGLLQSFAPARNTSTILKDILSDS